MGGTPPNPSIEGERPTELISLRITMHREPTMECGGVIKGRHPQVGVVCPNTHKTEKQPPHNMQCAKTMQEHRKHGAPGGCVHPWGVYEHTGGI